MCKVAEVSRAGYYRYAGKEEDDRDMELRDAIQKIALKMPTYGYRRVLADLRRQGWSVNRKRVRRIMREDNLLCIRRRAFVVTTDSNHDFPIRPNLAKDMVLTGPDQLWVADITYIRLQHEFVFLAVILDAFSRRVIGWELDRTLKDDLTLAALRMALSTRKVGLGLVHHSDRGSQYASGDYTKLLEDHDIKISMSRKANPYDNAKAESFMKTLKYEEVYRSEYTDLSHARSEIRRFLEVVYNQKRLHSALGYRPPVEFERDLSNPKQPEARA